MTLQFGKYQGKTLEQVVRFDPQYLQWLAREGKVSTAMKLRIENLLEPNKVQHIKKIIVNALEGLGYTTTQSVQMLHRVEMNK